MKYFGLILITLGIALLLFLGYSFVREKNKMVSPLPEEKGVKVIYITPAK